MHAGQSSPLCRPSFLVSWIAYPLESPFPLMFLGPQSIHTDPLNPVPIFNLGSISWTIPFRHCLPCYGLLYSYIAHVTGPHLIKRGERTVVLLVTTILVGPELSLFRWQMGYRTFYAMTPRPKMARKVYHAVVARFPSTVGHQSYTAPRDSARPFLHARPSPATHSHVFRVYS